jgi:hypothetical protein
MKKLVNTLRLALTLAPTAVLAQGFPEFGPGKLESPLTTGGQVITVLQNIVLWFGILIGIVAVFAILWSAFLFITAGGSIVVALFASVIVPIVLSFLSGTLF